MLKKRLAIVISVCTCQSLLFGSIGWGQVQDPPTFSEGVFEPPKVPAQLVSSVVSNGSVEGSGAPSEQTVQEESYHQGRLLAIVGTEHVIEGDLVAMVQPVINENAKRIPPGQIDKFREQLIRQALTNHVETKALAQQFLADMVGAKPQKELEELKKKLRPRLTKAFHTQYVPKMIEKFKVNDALALDAKLRESGSSLSSQMALFQESVMANEAVESNIPADVDVEWPELKEYYEAHSEDWQIPGKATWRQISVLFRNHNTRDGALAKITEMGNEIIFGGAPFDAIAKRKSEDPAAAKGGKYTDIEQKSLRSEAIDETVFAIPLNRLSLIVEDEDGFHIVEVLERTSARTIPIAEAQLQVRKQLIEERKEKLRKEYIAQVREKTPVWTLWPEDIPGSKSLDAVVAR